MTAFYGKLAWNYLSHSSLWARHARSRFSIGGKGSCLWKTISPFISSLSFNSRWILGNGKTLTSLFCQNLGLPFPKRFKSKTIKEVLSVPDLRRVFLHNMNPRIFLSIQGDLLDDSSDRFIWEGDPTGCVTTASFLKSFVPSSPSIKKFEVIWHSWLPVKISCFLWKVLHSALPTNDNVIKTGVQMASMCVCCRLPQTETMEHLLLFSDHANWALNILCPLFRKVRPRTVHQFFYDWGVNADFGKFSDCLGFGLLSCCLWDIWTYRNQVLYDDHADSFRKGSIFKWSPFLSNSIKAPFFQDSLSRIFSKALLINPPDSSKCNILWIPWQPTCRGNTCNIAIFVDDVSSRMAAVIRDSSGRFVAGVKFCSRNKQFFHCLVYLLHELHMLNLKYNCLKISHLDVSLLGRDSVVDWEVLLLKRQLVRRLKAVEIFRTSHSLNRPAAALCFSKHRYVFATQMEGLPRSAARALANDYQPHPCSFYDQRIHI